MTTHEVTVTPPDSPTEPYLIRCSRGDFEARRYDAGLARAAAHQHLMDVSAGTPV